jgi:DNA modification methylase
MSRKLQAKKRQRAFNKVRFNKALAIARRETRAKKAKPKAAAKIAATSSAIGSVHGGSLKAHPLALLVPPMSEADFQALKSAIAIDGQQEPGLLYEGQVLDGNNRNRVCHELKIPFHAIDFKGTEEEALNKVYSKVVGRHLTLDQKAAAAVRFEEKFAAEAKARSLANLKNARPWTIGETIKLLGGAQLIVQEYRGKSAVKVRDPNVAGDEGAWCDINNIKSTLEPGGRSRDRAAVLFGVNPRYVQTCKALLQHDKKLFEAVFNGQLKVGIAARALHREKKKRGLLALPPLVVDLQNCTVDVGDNVELLPDFPRRFAKLIVADPQYNIGFDYGKGAKADRLSDKDYLDRAQEWIAQCADILTPDGSIWVVINHEYAARYEIIMRELGLHPRAWVTWYETFGNNCQENFNRTSRRLLYFTRHPSNFTFNRPPFIRPSARQIIYQDKRADHDGKLQDDVWIIPRLVDNAKERIPEVPTQLPKALVQPIVEGCSDPGDLVLDPFNGSGTTGECCLLTGRIFRGIDISKNFAELARARWARCAANLQKLNKAELELATGKKQEAA